MKRHLEPTAIIETKTAPRRQLKFNCMNCLKGELDRIEQAGSHDAIRTTGNWSAGQILSHCSMLMRFSIDGFPSRAPAPFRVVARLLFKKKAVSGKPMPSGFQLPKGAAYMLPQPDVTLEQGMAEIREQIARVDAGQTFNQPSPLFGKLTHDEWLRLHLSHCEMHLGFIQYDASV